MKNYLKKIFSLDDKGAKDLSSASMLTVLINIILIAINIPLYFFLYDTVIPVLNNMSPHYETVLYISYSLLLFIMLIVANYFQYNACYVSAYELSSNKRISIAETLRRLPLSFFGKKDLSDVATVIMSDTTMLETAFSHFVPQMIGSIISTTIIGISLLIFNFKMGLAIFWVVPVSFFLVIATKKFQDSFGIKSKSIQLSYLDKIQECIENVADIKSNNCKESHLLVMKDRLEKFENASIKGEFVIGILVNLAQMILRLGIGTSMIAGVYLLVSGDIDILFFLFSLMLVTRVFEPLSLALVNLAGTYMSLLSVARMKELENTKIQTGRESMNNDGYDIKFSNVSFSYHTDQPVLDDISFVAKQGSITALIGPSGGGKSTALKLASRFWDIDSGSITIGGENISEIDPETLLENISIVFQDVVLFDNTVMENIRIGRKSATDEEVIEVAKKASCHDYITALPNGYNTLIGENGCNLSGGERQRLSIARALLKDAPIVLLDEATSSLDVKNEIAVQQAIANLTKNKTVVIVAHRMRTIIGADKIVLLKEGRISEMGTHKELIKQEGDYVNMIKLQMETINWQLI